jgi:hypothetical protein
MLTKLWDKLTTPNHLMVAQRQLAVARCKLMEVESNASYATLMITYYSDMVARHERLLSQSNNTTTKGQFSTEDSTMKK